MQGTKPIAASTKGGPTKADTQAGAPQGSLRQLLYGLLKPGMLLGCLFAAGLLIQALPGIHHFLLDRGLLRGGVHGRLIFLVAGFLICVFGLPRQAVAFAGGFAYGPIVGALLTTAANGLACLVDMLWARLLARGLVRRRLMRGRLASLDAFVTRNPFVSILTLRLLPVGSSLMVSLLAGVSNVRIVPFISATLLGSLPQTLIFGLIGSGTEIGQTPRIALGIALFVASGLAGTLLLRRSSWNETQV